ncbi:MAG: hypothetical protein QXH30_03710, partial [Candidatus Bilamarchaeaceae archaeon]
MSGKTLSSGSNGQRNGYFIDEAAMELGLSQRFRMDAMAFASERRIPLRSVSHARAFLRYFRVAHKVEKLLTKAMRKSGYSNAELKKAFEILYEDFNFPSTSEEANLLLQKGRDALSKAPEKALVAKPAGAAAAPKPGELHEDDEHTGIFVVRGGAIVRAGPEKPQPRQAKIYSPEDLRRMREEHEAGLPPEQKKSLKFIRSVAAKNGFSEEEVQKAFRLCKDYNWFPRAPKFAVLKSTKQKKEKEIAETLDILNQARHGPDYIEILAGHRPQGDAHWAAAVSMVKSRYAATGQRITSEQALSGLMEEFSFAKNPAAYAYAFGRSHGYSIKVSMDVSAALSKKADGKVEPLPPRHISAKPEEYCKALLEQAKRRLSFSAIPGPKALSKEEMVQNFNMLNAMNRERERVNVRQHPPRVLNLAQGSARAKGTIFSSLEEAEKYCMRAEAYLESEKAQAKLIRKVARKNGYDKDEAEAAISMCRDCLVILRSQSEALDFLLQARLAAEHRKADYIWPIAEGGNYSYEVALEIERRYMQSGVALTHRQVIACLDEESVFRADTYRFVENVAARMTRESKISGFGPRFIPGDIPVVGLAYALRQHLNGNGDSWLPPEISRLSREALVRNILASPGYSRMLEAKWQEYTASMALVKKAAEDYASQANGCELNAGRAVEEACRRIREDGERARNLREAKALFGDSLWLINSRHELQNRVKKNLLPGDIADAAWAVISTERRNFGSLEEEVAFYSELFSERGHPYPASLAVYLAYRWGKIGRDVAEAAIASLHEGGPTLLDWSSTATYLMRLDAELARKKAEEGQPEGTGHKP